MLGAAACSGSKDNDADASAPDATAVSEAGLDVTPDYIAGEWCYRSFEAGDDKSDENITYDFAPDGTLKYQTNSSTPVDEAGSYEFKDGLLVIKPALAFFKLKPVTLGENDMVFEAMGGRSIWSRAACQS